MVKRLVKLLISIALWSGDCAFHHIGRFIRRPKPGRTTILYYHAVPSNQRTRFARQMDLLKRLATPVVADVRRHIPGHGLKAAVTFDDGFRSVLKNALPELLSRGIPFTIFFPTGSWDSRPSWIHDPRHPSWNERVLSEAELRQLAQEPLATIASHSVTHPNFLHLDPVKANIEFQVSRQTLEHILQRTVDLFSFPHGAHNRQLVEMAHAAGYFGVFTVEPDTAPQPSPSFVSGRVATNPDDWQLEFRLKLSGAYRWQSWLHKSWASSR